MSLSTQYTQDYQQAVSAYMNGRYEAAASDTDQLIQDNPEDPNLRLLRGHIYYCLQQYDTAQTEYQRVLDLTEDSELRSCAQSSLTEIAAQRPDAETEATLSDFDLAPDASPLSAGTEATHLQASASDSAPADDHNAPEPAMVNPFTTDWNAAEHNHHATDTGAADVNLDDDTLLMGHGDPTAEAEAEVDPALHPEQLEQMTVELTQEETGNLNGLPAHASDPATANGEGSTESPSLDLLDLVESGSEDVATHEEMNFLDADIDFTTDLGDVDNQPHLAGEDPLEATTGLDTIVDSGGQEDFSGDLLDMDDLLSAIDSESSLSLDQLAQAEPSLSPDPDAELMSASSGEIVTTESYSPTATRQKSWGLFAPYANATLVQKQLITAAAVGVVSAGAVMVVAQGTGMSQKVSWSNLGLSALVAGAGGAVTTLALGRILVRQLKVCTNDLSTQFSAVSRGAWNVKASELSQDEFGQLGIGFNKMMEFIEVTTSDARRKAEEQEKAKEDLQRQVIRLLDDVEGAARGDLTVQAEVTADILGAVADSFNLTIYNLQKIVTQVKLAAREVNKGAADNESFARSLSSDALRQAEELAVTLNSVQMMTTSIQKVAESARAADQVTQRASEAALKGGESVESTVAGILQIRETVAETTRKVKRLAESSQEISQDCGLDFPNCFPHQPVSAQCQY